ncbi:MAG: sensor histidine kinase [Bacteroidales bacterium]|nr:sensor histidine kinase [Bacteroidales bacterium]
MRKYLLAFIRNSFSQHLLFWAVSGYVLMNIFSLSSSFQRIDYLYTAIFIFTLVIPVELNLLVFIPRFLKRKHYIVYALLFIASLHFFSFFNQLFFRHLVDYIFPGYYFISYYSFSDILKFFLVFMGLTTLLHLSKEWFELNEARQKLIILEKEKTEAELRALINQVNPHFLFNSLNVLYSLTKSKRKEAPEAILKLSDILRYVIYDSLMEEIKLGSEIKLINDYIDLQRFRTNADNSISFKTEVDDDQMMIAPMLCLPLIENSFKHGLKAEVKDIFLIAMMKAKSGIFRFEVENNRGYVDEMLDKDPGGVGLKNIQHRLELLYPGRHSFTIRKTNRVFKVIMEIQKNKLS